MFLIVWVDGAPVCAVIVAGVGVVVGSNCEIGFVPAFTVTFG